MPVENKLEETVENVQETVTKNVNKIDLKGLGYVAGAAVTTTVLIIAGIKAFKKLKNKKAEGNSGAADNNSENVITEAQA